MYAIYIRGRQEPVTCDDFSGQAIARDFQQGNMEEMLDIEGVIFPSKSINRIEPNYRPDTSGKEQEMKSNNDFYYEEKITFDKLKAQRLAMPIEERAKHMELAQLTYFWITGEKEIPKDQHEEVYRRQVEDLRKYPDNMYANPVCLKGMWAFVDEPTLKENIHSIKSLARISAQKLVEHTMQNA